MTQRPSEHPAAPLSGTAYEERGTTARPLIVEIPSTEESRREAREQAEHEEKAAKREQSLVNWTKGLTAVTGLLVIFTGGLWWATRRVVVDGREVFVHAQESSEKQLRPYVFMQKRIFNWLHDPASKKTGRAVRVTVTWQNMGQTPARRVEVNLSAKGFVGPIPEDFDFADLIPATASGSIGPGGTIESRFQFPLTEFGTPTAPNHVYYWGWIEYDGFPESGRHRTEVCALIVPNADVKIATVEFSDVFKTAFNGADEDCWKKPKDHAANLATPVGLLGALAR